MSPEARHHRDGFLDGLEAAMVILEREGPKGADALREYAAEVRRDRIERLLGVRASPGAMAH